MAKKFLEAREAQELLMRHKIDRGAINDMLDQSVPVMEQARRIHRSWANTAKQHGWEYGLVRDPDRRRDPRLVPFDELSEELRREFYNIASEMRDTGSMN